jgi:hypothetical protein
LWLLLSFYAAANRFQKLANRECLFLHPSLEMQIFYDNPDRSILFQKDGITPQSGLVSLVEECKDLGTPAILISKNKDRQKIPDQIQDYMTVFDELQKPPNPRSLFEAINSVTVQPEGFGGSSGFGRKLAEPERHPMPQYVVVFCEDTDVCRAGRYCGMRVISFQDNDLADAVVDSFDFYLEDISTPGSFWLNPPFPSDDDGNKVDIFELMDRMERDPKDENLPSDISDDEKLQSILDDMDPL